MATKQNWTVGAQVKVGFLTLHVCFLAPLGGGAAVLRGGTKFYSFVPYCGLSEVSRAEAEAIVAAAKAAYAAREDKAAAAREALANAEEFAASLAA